MTRRSFSLEFGIEAATLVTGRGVSVARFVGMRRLKVVIVPALFSRRIVCNIRRALRRAWLPLEI
ncbi:MAG: hypothetical protein AB8B85_11475 [Paracoccaceae bacterium]